MRRLKVLSYVQALSGVGHQVRAGELARALAEARDVLLVEGGRPVPRPSFPAALRRLELPAIYRNASGALQATQGPRESVMAERSARLRRAVLEFAPEVVLVEHYPFSKWLLQSEVDALLATARSANPRVRVWCSLRDVCRQTAHEPVDAETYATRVLDTLQRDFQGVLVHGDPRVTTLSEHLAFAPSIRVPVHHTGYVCEQFVEASPPAGLQALRERGQQVVVCSFGGSSSGFGRAQRVVAAWQGIEDQPEFKDLSVVLFSGLHFSAEQVGELRAAARGSRVQIERFAPDFVSWLTHADLSLSQAGYNTCANLLGARVRAVLVPDAAMSDQPFRAQRLADLELATLLNEPELDAHGLGRALQAARTRPRPEHRIALDGAHVTARILDADCA
jgi:predicted glycosyltransferase